MYKRYFCNIILHVTTALVCSTILNKSYLIKELKKKVVEGSPEDLYSSVLAGLARNIVHFRPGAKD